MAAIAGLEDVSIPYNKRIMWLCGKEILRDYPELETYSARVGGGGVRALSYKSVGREIERSDHAIKAWVDLVKEKEALQNCEKEHPDGYRAMLHVLTSHRMVGYKNLIKLANGTSPKKLKGLE